jgi:tetratricopeptide (TPR) repeat protein
MNWRRKIVGLLVLTLLCVPLALFASKGFEHLGAGLKLFQEERYTEASKEFNLALYQNPELTDARYYLAVSYFNEKEYRKARKQFELLLPTRYPKDWIVYYLARLDLEDGFFSSAIQRFDLLTRRAEPLRDEFYYLGVAFMKEKEPAKAVPPLLREIAFNPRDFRAHYLLARAYLKMGQQQKAEREYKVSENLHRYYSNGQAELMKCHAKLSSKQVDQAWSECSSVLKTNDIDKLVAVGMLFGQFHLYAYALQAFQKAFALDPDSPAINYDLGYTYYQNKNYDLARRFLGSAIQLRPYFFEALVADGAVLYALGKGSAAAKILQRARALRPGDREVNDLLAQIKQRRRGSDE